MPIVRVGLWCLRYAKSCSRETECRESMEDGFKSKTGRETSVEYAN